MFSPEIMTGPPNQNLLNIFITLMGVSIMDKQVYKIHKNYFPFDNVFPFWLPSLNKFENINFKEIDISFSSMVLQPYNKSVLN